MALIDGLISYWKLDDTDNTNAVDSHGSHPGTQEGTVTDEAGGKLGTAFDFDGGEGYVNILDHADWDATDGISISCWVYADSLGVWNAMVNQWDSTSASTSAWTMETVGADFRFYIYDGAAKFASSTNTATTGSWHHVVGVFEGDGETNGLKIYVDNTIGGTTTTITTANTAAFPVRIGDFNDTINAWDGRIDEVGIWSRGLTSEEVTELWNGGAGLAYPFAAVGTNTQIQIGDAWKEVPKMQININDVWKEVASAQINIGDAWKSIF